MQRQSDVMRTFDESHETPYPSRQQYFGTVENAPVSPRQLPQDDARRQGGLTVPQPRGQPMYRPTVPSNLSIGARRYGSAAPGTAPSFQCGTTSRQPRATAYRCRHPRTWLATRSLSVLSIEPTVSPLAIIPKSRASRGSKVTRVLVHILTAGGVAFSLAISSNHATAGTTRHKWRRQQRSRYLRHVVMGGGRQQRRQRVRTEGFIGTPDSEGEHGPYFEP